MHEKEKYNRVFLVELVHLLRIRFYDTIFICPPFDCCCRDFYSNFICVLISWRRKIPNIFDMVGIQCSQVPYLRCACMCVCVSRLVTHHQKTKSHNEKISDSFSCPKFILPRASSIESQTGWHSTFGWYTIFTDINSFIVVIVTVNDTQFHQ